MLAPPRPRAGAGRDGVLARALGRARWTIFWERLWPALASIATVIGLFLAVSWLGLWLWLPPIGRAIGLGVFFLLAAAAFAPLLMLRFPSRMDGLRRLDRNSGLPHRPATAIADEIAAADRGFVRDGAVARPCRAGAAGGARRSRPARRRRGWRARDPFAVRALVVVLVVATFFAAGGERLKRIAAAFDWQGVIVPANFRIDAWVSPPTYTGRPPVILQGLRPGEPVQTATALSVPAGSTLVIRATGIHLDVVASGGLAEPASGAQSAGAKGTEERRFVINDAGAATVRGAAASDVTWQFTAIPDKPPTIALAKDPEGQARGALQLAYKLEDDYGVVGAQATLQAAEAAKAPTASRARALYDAPDFPLVLPQARTKNGVGQTTKDLTEHPWAGVDVAMILTARDEAGNEGQSAAFEFRLPERPFAKPMARALIEQRRESWRSTATPRRACSPRSMRSRWRPNVSTWRATSISACARSSGSSRARRATISCATSLRACGTWRCISRTAASPMPSRPCARRRRRCARRWSAGASDEEIKKLTDQLRAALDKFLQALAEQMRKNPQQLARPLDPNTPPAAPAGSAEHDRQARADGTLRAPRMRRARCCRSSSRCWRTCRWPAPASRWTVTATTT